MNVASLKSYIKTGQLPSIMFFAGTEWQVQKLYIEQIKKVLGVETRRIDAVREILNSLRSKSILQQNYLYIVRDDKEFLSNEKLRERVKNTIGHNTLILLITKLDKRTKFYNQYKDAIIEFEDLQDEILRKYIKKHIPDLSDKNCNTLIEICEHDYGRILLEIDKIKRYYEGHRLPAVGYYDSVFEDLIKSGTIYRPAQDVIFELIDAIMLRNKDRIFQLLEESYASGEATLVMLTNLFNSAKAVLQLQTCTSKDVGKSTGLTGWQIMKAKNLTGHYKGQELIKMLHLIREVETGIKIGKIEDRFAMEYLLCEIL